MSDFIETGEYRGFKIGHQDVCSGVITQGYIKAGDYGIPLKARYGETEEGLRKIVDEIYEIVHQENGGQL